MEIKSAFKELKHDLPASIVVFFVAVPLCLGIALASGAPMFAGIIAGIVGGIVVGMASGSTLGVSGPAAGLAVIVLTSISTLGGSWEMFLTAVVLAGVFQLILGFVKAGFVAYFFPSAVIKGMLTGIGLLIILKQIPHALGWDKDLEGDFAFYQPDGETTFSEIFQALLQVDGRVREAPRQRGRAVLRRKRRKRGAVYTVFRKLRMGRQGLRQHFNHAPRDAER